LVSQFAAVLALGIPPLALSSVAHDADVVLGLLTTDL
jgi:hypothetical protein